MLQHEHQFFSAKRSIDIFSNIKYKQFLIIKVLAETTA